MAQDIPDYFLSALASFGLPSPQAQRAFWERCALKRYPKNEILFSEKKRNSLEYLLLEGVLHRFNENEAGESVTTGFYLGNAVVTPHFARTVQGVSLFSLQALTEVEVAEIPVSELDSLRYSDRAFQMFGIKVIEEAFSKNLLVDIAHRSGDAKARLDLLRDMYPNIENLAPHHVIASYLGMSPVTLSRIRAQLKSH